MSKWVPGVALFGLICVMLLPAPGVLGIAIGACCVVAIAVSALALLLDIVFTRVTTPLIAAYRRAKARKRKARAVHAGSGMARKVTRKAGTRPDPQGDRAGLLQEP